MIIVKEFSQFLGTIYYPQKITSVTAQKQELLATTLYK
jgi:hypothetical protein